MRKTPLDPEIFTVHMSSEIQPIIDELVSVAHGNQAGLKPESLQVLEAWAEDDGYQDLIDAWKGELIVLDLEDLSTWSFSDSELIDYKDCEEDEIDDTLRLEYARERIAAEFDSGSEDYVFSVHQYPIVSRTGQKAILGYTGQFQGQAGIAWYYRGAFLSEAALMEHLRQYGFVLQSEVSAIPDATLLGLWQD